MLISLIVLINFIDLFILYLLKLLYLIISVSYYIFCYQENNPVKLIFLCFLFLNKLVFILLSSFLRDLIEYYLMSIIDFFNDNFYLEMRSLKKQNKKQRFSVINIKVFIKNRII